MLDKLNKEIDSLSKEYGFAVISLDYDEKIFGNIILDIVFQNSKYTFVTDLRYT